MESGDEKIGVEPDMVNWTCTMLFFMDPSYNYFDDYFENYYEKYCKYNTFTRKYLNNLISKIDLD